MADEQLPQGFARLPASTVRQSGGSSTRLANKGEVIDSINESADYATQAAKSQVDLESMQAKQKAQSLDDQAAMLAPSKSPADLERASEATLARADERLDRADALYAEATKGIDPDRFFRDKGAASKVAMGIGMALSSLAEGMSFGKVRNVARRIIDEAVNRDVAAQRVTSELAMRRGEREQSIYGALRAQGLSEQDAAQASRGVLMQSIALSAQADAARLMASEPAKAARLSQLAASSMADAKEQIAKVLGRESSTYTSGTTTTPGELVKIDGVALDKEQKKSLREAESEFQSVTGTADVVKKTIGLALESHSGGGDPLDTQITWDGEKIIGVLPLGGAATAQLNAALPMLIKIAKSMQGDVGATSESERALFEAMYKSRGFKTTARDLLASIARFNLAANSKRRAIYQGQIGGASPEVIGSVVAAEKQAFDDYARLFRQAVGSGKTAPREPTGAERQYMDRLRHGR